MVTFENNKAGRCAKEFIQFLIDNDLWQDTFIYVNGVRYGCYGPDGHYHYGPSWDNVFKEEDKDPHDYFNYVGSFMSVSTEGPLYEILNGYYGTAGWVLTEKLNNIFAKYGKYYELGDAWNFSLYNI